MHVHFVAVAGTGMGALAGLCRAAGHRVTGSDVAFYPPMGDALRAWGIETLEGFSPDHLAPAPDLVVIGNVCRPANVEARAAIDRGLRYVSMPGALAELFLRDRKSLVVAGTHGKTTTSSLLAYLLHAVGADPGFLVGGIPGDFPTSYRIGHVGGPFVIEGDEYDSAFFEKSPKMWQYLPSGAIVTSIEHDHIDIYPTLESYLAAFTGFVERMPDGAALVVAADDPRVRAVVRDARRLRVIGYGVEGDDTADLSPRWVASPRIEGTRRLFDLRRDGSLVGTARTPLSGLHNVRNATAAIALAHEACDVPIDALLGALEGFRGVRRRQELVADVAGVSIYDDFAHHPTAVRETVRALRERHPAGRLAAVFEPRSATASRRLHQDEYTHAFDDAHLTLLAPVGRPEIPAPERLDVEAIARELRSRGREASAPESLDAIVAALVGWARPGDAIALFSNGAFGGIHAKLRAALEAAPPSASSDGRRSATP
ncbi:MAG: UDP-N-acetylmuramate:L-alanyl-gamma-D-glutamyl-meso-diaminopimelate ligase [Deltaproteobacteria bacterium]|nr:UDP-N-acetylmuramate:L-alanyl-gamma-D-glutamyl-meso-diaminopimelate ligase [Deltaproteobacteria bacterium]